MIVVSIVTAMVGRGRDSSVGIVTRLRAGYGYSCVVLRQGR